MEADQAEPLEPISPGSLFRPLPVASYSSSPGIHLSIFIFL